jgi:hypothetical protein
MERTKSLRRLRGMSGPDELKQIEMRIKSLLSIASMTGSSKLNAEIKKLMQRRDELRREGQ